jgi:tetratricopeptide (TPR) repeat protein
MDKTIRVVSTRLSMLLVLAGISGVHASDVCDMCSDLPNPFTPVPIHKESISAKWRKPFHDIRKTLDKKYRVFADELEDFESVPFERVKADPVFYLDRRILIDVYFAKQASFYKPFISPFQQDTHLNFSAWPYGAELWTKEGRNLVHPMFYIDKVRKELTDKLTRVPMFTPVRLFAYVRSKADDYPWLEVVGFEVIPDVTLNETSLRQLELGHVQLSKKRYDVAAQTLEEAIKTQLPVNAELKAYTMLGRAYTELRWYSHARNALVNAVLRDKTNVTNLILLARADLRLDKPDEARQAAELAVNIEPGNAAAHAELGLALAMLDDIRGGYKAIEVAQKLSRNQLPEANRNRAMIALREGKLELARNELNQAVIFRPTDVDLKLELGDVYLMLNDVEKARLEFNQARDLAPHRPEAYYKVALLLKKQADALKKDGKTDDANKLYNEALENVQTSIQKDDTFTPAFGLQAEILRALGRADDAKKVLEIGAKIKGNVGPMQEYFYQAATALGDWAAMEKAVRNMISMRPNAMLYSRLGNILANRPEPDMAGAASAYESAIAAAPDRADDLAALGYIRVQHLNDYHGAESALVQAVKLQPQDSAAWYSLSLAQRNLGKLDDAIKAADESVKIDPSVKARNLAALTRVDRGSPSDIEAAAEISKKTIEDASNDGDKAWAQVIYAVTQLKSGRGQDAVDLFPQADMLQSKSSEYNLWYGQALAKAGVQSGAAEHFRSAMELSQGNLRSSSVSQRVYTEAQTGIKELGVAAKAKPKPVIEEPKAAEKTDPEKSPTTKQTSKKGAPVIEEPEKSQPVPVEVPGPR